MAAIFHKEPPPLDVPPALGRVIGTCLEKNPDHRFQNALDLRRAITWAMERQSMVAAEPKRWRWHWAVIAGVAALAAILGGWVVARSRQTPPAAEQALRFQIPPPEGGRFDFSRGFAVSPDGRSVAFVATAQGKTGLWLRPLDGTAARLLPGTEEARNPFWSPDARSVAYSGNGKLWRVEVGGGPPVAICEGDTNGGSWGTDGVIVFASVASQSLQRVPASGGSPTPLTTMDSARGETGHFRPQFLAGGRLLLRVMAIKPEDSGLYAISLANPKERVRLVSTPSSALYAAGHLLWLRGTTLVAQRFDPDRLQVIGEPVPLADPVGANAVGVMHVAVSTGDVLLHGQSAATTQHTWLDRAGKAVSTFGAPTDDSDFRISPDGRRVAVSRPQLGGWDLWMADVERSAWSRFTFLAGNESAPVWSPDGKQLMFRAGSARNLYRKEASGAGTEERIIKSENALWPTDWSRDGRLVLYHEMSPDMQRDMWVLPVTPDGKHDAADKARLYLRTRFDEFDGRFSPEPSPRWVAYVSDESGRNEVYVQAFPEPRGKWQISTGGGTDPEWSPDGRELYYLSRESKLMAVSLKLGTDAVEPSSPREMFAVPGDSRTHPYAMAPDGKRFLVRAPLDQAALPLEVIVNWPALLRKGAAAE